MLQNSWSAGIVGDECAVLTEAGVIDEDVDDEPCAFSCIEDLLRSRGIEEVGDHDARLNTFGGELGGESVKAIAAARCENEFCAAAG